MQADQFLISVQEKVPPPGISPHLEALWWDKKGHWQRAHELIQNLPDRLASAIHAYLHRQEGDLWNARYWYSRAGVPEVTTSSEAEWYSLVRQALK